MYDPKHTTAASTSATAGYGRGHGRTVGLPDFHVAAVLFLAPIVNWLAILAILALDVLPLALRLLHGAAFFFHANFERLCVPVLTASVRTSIRTLARAFALVATVVATLRWAAASLHDYYTLATATVDDATQKICVLLFSSEYDHVLQRGRTNRTRDLLHDMDLCFVEMDVATTIDMRDKLLQQQLLDACKVRTFPQVFTVEMEMDMVEDKPMPKRIRYIQQAELDKAEFYLGVPVAELARLSVLDLSVHRLFAGVPKRKVRKAFVE